MKIMKNKMMKYILPVIVLTMVMAACDDDLTKLPPQSVPTLVALNTDENVKQVLIGAYDALSFTDLFGGEILRNSELLASDNEIRFTGTFNAPAEIWTKDMTTSNGDVSEAWLDGYNTINITNNVLSALEVVDAADRDLVEGEARFIRALVYFEEVKYFAIPYSAGNAGSNPGVPIVLDPTTEVNEASQVARSSVQAVYDQVISDLTIAISKLPPSNGVFANSVAANTILARVYLQMGDYSNALSAVNSALNDASGNYLLTSSYDGAFNNESNSFEDIFSIQVTTQDPTNAMQLYYGPTLENGRGDIEINQAHLDFYDPADERLAFHYADPSTGETRTGKWVEQFANVGTIRLAELYLIRAEANVRLGSTSGDTPANDLNRIRNRAGLPNIANPTLNDVMLERKLELAHEGHAIHDFKRTQGDSYRLTDQNGVTGDGLVDGFAYDADELIYPIPDREINVNSKLTQNSGY